MTFKTLKSVSCAVGLASFIFFVPTALAGEMCHCTQAGHGHAVNGTAISTERVGNVTVYRGPSVSYDYAGATRARQNNERSKQAQKARRAQSRTLSAQAAQINRLEGKVDALSAQPKKQQTLSSIYGYGRTYRGNNRFFGRNGFIGNSNFSGATVQLPNRSRGRRGLRRGTVKGK